MPFSPRCESSACRRLTEQGKIRRVKAAGREWAPPILMLFRLQISIVLILAFLVNSACACAAAKPDCSMASCAAHERHGACPMHGHHQNSRGGHECCQEAACSGPAEVSSDSDSVGASHFVLQFPATIGALIVDHVEGAARLAVMTTQHSPPSAVPLFLAIRSLLL